MSKNKQSIQILRGSTSNSQNEVLLPGQPFYDKTTRKLYVGDGSDTILNLKGTEIGLQLENDGSLDASNYPTLKATYDNVYLNHLNIDGTTIRTIPGDDDNISIKSDESVIIEAGSSTIIKAENVKIKNEDDSNLLTLEDSSNILYPSQQVPTLTFNGNIKIKDPGAGEGGDHRKGYGITIGNDVHLFDCDETGTLGLMGIDDEFRTRLRLFQPARATNLFKWLDVGVSQDNSDTGGLSLCSSENGNIRLDANMMFTRGKLDFGGRGLIENDGYQANILQASDPSDKNKISFFSRCNYNGGNQVGIAGKVDGYYSKVIIGIDSNNTYYGPVVTSSNDSVHYNISVGQSAGPDADTIYFITE